jgi:hypothetical protein
VIRTRSLRRHRDLERARLGALAVVGALVAHDAIFAAQHGLGPERDLALEATAHGYWPAFIALALLAGAAGLGVAIAGVLRLRRLVRGLPAAAPDGRGYPREVARLWPRLIVLVGAAFLVQENVEHVVAGQAAPGLWALSGPAYPLAIPVIIGVTGLLAAVGGWLRWHHQALVRRLVAARAAARRRRRDAARGPHRRWALVAALVAHRWILLRRDAERAPPVPALA